MFLNKKTSFLTRERLVAQGGAQLMQTFRIAVLPGDGIGTEVIPPGHRSTGKRFPGHWNSGSSGPSLIGHARPSKKTGRMMPENAPRYVG